MWTRHCSLCLIAVALLLLSLGVNAQAGSFYVDWNKGSDTRGTGSSDAPWQTIVFSARYLQPGDTLWVRSGADPYREYILNCIPSGTDEEHRVTIKWDGVGKRPVIQPAGVQDEILGIEDGASYITVEGLEIDGLDTAGFGVGWANGSHHLRFKDLDVHNARHIGFEGGTHHNEFLNCLSHDNDVAGTVSEPGGPLPHGMYLSDDSSVVDGCVFYNNPGYGIQIWPPHDNNTIRNCTSYRNGGGFEMSGVGNTIYNCVAYDNKGHGIVVYGGRNQRIYNCTVCNNERGIYVSGNPRSGHNPGGEVRNSIVLSAKGGIEDDGQGIPMTNNVTDTNAVRFVNAADRDFHLTGNSAACVDGGYDLSAIFTTDKDGKPRSGAFDIGAYEYAGE